MLNSGPMPEQSQSNEKKCFVIAPIGKKDSNTRKRSDRVLEHVFKAALSPEYRVQRADEISEPGMITSQVLQAVQDYDLVLADLTEHNPNVFYELAVRHAIEKPIIHVIDTQWQIPFDVAGFRTIAFDFTDLDSVAAAIKEIRNQASEVNKGKWGVTPIKVAGLMRRTHGESQETLLLQQTLKEIAAIRVDTRKDLQAVMGYLAERIEALRATQSINSFVAPFVAGYRTNIAVDSSYGPTEGTILGSSFGGGLDPASAAYIAVAGSRPLGSIEVESPVVSTGEPEPPDTQQK